MGKYDADAAAVVVNSKNEFLLMFKRSYEYWEFPKGHMEGQEDELTTMDREVKEETGLDGKIIEKIDHIEYFYSHKDPDVTHRIFKIVYFFLMEHTGGDVSEHDKEVDDCRWVPIDEAIGKIEYKDERDILKKAKEMIAGID